MSYACHTRIFHSRQYYNLCIIHVCHLDCCREQELSTWNSLLCADNRAGGGQLVLSPRVIFDAVLQLEVLLNKLEPVVADVIKDVDNKKLVKQSIHDFCSR